MPANNEKKSVQENSHDFFNRISHFCDENIRIIKNVPYGIGLVGLLLVGRSIRVDTFANWSRQFKRCLQKESKRFTTAKCIPQEFIDKRITLRARVKQCTSEGNLVLEHIPIVPLRLPFLKTKPPGNLILRLACVEHTEHSVCFLQQNVNDGRVWFSVLNRDQQTLEGFIYYRLGWIRRTVINEHLIKTGLARVGKLNKDLASNQLYNKTLERYLSLEVKADKKGVGIWKRPPLKERLKEYPKQQWQSTRSRIVDWFNKMFKQKD